MKTAKKPKAKPAAVKPKATTRTINLAYVEKIADEAIATVLALRALVVQLADERNRK
jgi:hypothetical protein